MAAAKDTAAIARQHLIDPEICIRCNTCEATCPIGAITHDERNYVVKFDVCNSCGACISPCPTGAIDNWRRVLSPTPYTVEQQLSWDTLPEPIDLALEDSEQLPEEVAALTALASSGQGGTTSAPWSAARAYVNLFGIKNPAIATVTGNFRLTAADASSDVRHLVLDFGATEFPVLEGQSIGILAPATGLSS